MGPVILGTILYEQGHDVIIYNENATGSVLDDPSWALIFFGSLDIFGLQQARDTP
jgi:hypothetical protein